MELSWSTIIPAIVLTIVAIIVLIVVGIGISRVNTYQSSYTGIDLINVDTWMTQLDDNHLTGQAKAKNVQTAFVISIIANLVLAIPTLYIAYNFYGRSFAVMYGIVAAVLIIYWFVYYHYLKNVENGQLIGMNSMIDVQHNIYSLTNVNFVLMLVHAIVAFCLAMYSVFVSKKSAGKLLEKPSETDTEAITGGKRTDIQWWSDAVRGRTGQPM